MTQIFLKKGKMQGILPGAYCPTGNQAVDLWGKRVFCQ